MEIHRMIFICGFVIHIKTVVAVYFFEVMLQIVMSRNCGSNGRFRQYFWLYLMAITFGPPICLSDEREQRSDEMWRRAKFCLPITQKNRKIHISTSSLLSMSFYSDKITWRWYVCLPFFFYFFFSKFVFLKIWRHFHCADWGIKKYTWLPLKTQQ